MTTLAFAANESTLGILRNRAALLAALAFCIYSAWPRSLPTLRLPNDRDPVFIFALLFSISLITIPIAIRSPLFGDRIVFGAASVSFILRGITLFVPSPSVARAFLFGCQNAVWTAAALGISLMLISPLRQSSGS